VLPALQATLKHEQSLGDRPVNEETTRATENEWEISAGHKARDAVGVTKIFS